MFGKRYFDAMQICCFPLTHYSLILAFIGGSCWQLLLLWCSNGGFCLPNSTFINWNSFVQKHFPLFPFIYLSNHLCQYWLMDIYSILWFAIQSYHYLFSFSNCSILPWGVLSDWLLYLFFFSGIWVFIKFRILNI